jgi:hypothetical protein
MGKRGRALLALAMLVCFGARAQAPSAPPLPPLPPEEARLVYNELLQTHDGFAYTAYVLLYRDEATARKVWAQINEPRFRNLRFERIFPTAKPRQLTSFHVDQATRDLLLSLHDGERGGPIPFSRGWVILERLSTRPSPAPKMEEMLPHLPAIVANGLVPSAAELQSTPALRMRTVANGIFNVDSLRAAPPDLDVNIRLSNRYTLLTRAIVLGQPDLVEALLARGANPNLCARRFCPLESALYAKSRPILDLLLKAGADVNQADPAVGAPEGPLTAAAALGDLEVATRLLAAGAKVDGLGRGPTPLMMAAQGGSRPMAELLLGKGANPFATLDNGLPRTALDAAEPKHAEVAALLRERMLARTKTSGDWAWQGWIEQDGRRMALEGKPVTLKRTPFRILVRMKPDQAVYATAATERLVLEQLLASGRDDAWRFNGNISFESKGADHLVVHVPGKSGSRWGGSQSWQQGKGGTSFAAVEDSPQGRLHAREIRDLVMIDGDKTEDVPVAGYRGSAIYLVLGTRVKLKAMEDDVFQPQMVELRFQ